MTVSARLTVAALCGALTLTACGRSPDESASIEASDLPNTPSVVAGERLAPPLSATKNTRRINADDPATVSADVALATFPATSPSTKPAAVALVDRRDWRTAIAAASLMAPPLRAPTLLTAAAKLTPETASALKRLGPTGAPAIRGAQVIRVGSAPLPSGVRTTDITAPANDPAATAAAIDSFLTTTRETASRRVIVVSSDDPAYAVPAAAWAAKSGDPVLFASRDAVPAATETALRSRRDPQILLLGPETVLSARVQQTLRRLGDVTRISGASPIDNAIAFARFSEDGVGWGVSDPGHGLVFARADQPLLAAAGSALSGAGTYGPLILLSPTPTLEPTVRDYLLDIQPGYEEDPARAVYNQGWILGGARIISLPIQGEIDGLLEVTPVQTETTPTTAAPATTTGTTPAAAATTTTPAASTSVTTVPALPSATAPATPPAPPSPTTPTTPNSTTRTTR